MTGLRTAKGQVFCQLAEHVSLRHAFSLASAATAPYILQCSKRIVFDIHLLSFLDVSSLNLSPGFGRGFFSRNQWVSRDAQGCPAALEGRSGGKRETSTFPHFGKALITLGCCNAA
jgi:hypothetical protein